MPKFKMLEYQLLKASVYCKKKKKILKAISKQKFTFEF